jgi:hypothetical protein
MEDKEIQNSKFKIALITIFLIVLLKIGGWALKVPENTTDSANNSLVMLALGYVTAKTAQNIFKKPNDQINKKIDLQNFPKDTQG